MIGSGMSRRDRVIVAAAVVAVLYALAVFIGLGGRVQEWTKARTQYERACKKFVAQKKLIARRTEWRARAKTEGLRMPVVGKDEGSTATRWKRVLDQLAAEHNVRLPSLQEQQEEEHGGVWELPIDVRFEAALGKLVAFLYALEHAEGVMFDVRNLDIGASRSGFLTGKFVLTCAYIKEGSAPVGKSKEGKAKK